MSRFYTDDPARDFDRQDIKQSQWLERRPKCSVCGHHIQDEEATHIENHWICEQCIKDHREWIEDYE